VLDVGASGIEGVDLDRVDIEADDRDAGIGKTKPEGKPDIAEADDGDFHGLEFKLGVWKMGVGSEGDSEHSTLNFQL